MTTYGVVTITGAASMLSWVVESADPVDLEARINATLASVPVGYVVVGMTLAGAGMGHVFTVTIDAGAQADVAGGFASPPEVRCFLASTGEVLQELLRDTTPSSGVVSDVQVAGASGGTRFMGMIVRGEPAPVPVCAVHVHVDSLADFPAPVASVITLADDTVYEICGTVDISPNTIVSGNRSAIVGKVATVDRLTSTFVAPGVGMIRLGASKQLSLRAVGLVAPGSRVLDVNGSTTAALTMVNITLTGAQAGYFLSPGRLICLASSIVGCADGITLEGAMGDMLFSQIFVSDNTGTFTAFKTPMGSGSTSEDLQFSVGHMNLGAGQTGFDFPDSASGLFPYRGLISAITMNTTGGGVALATGAGKLTKKDVRWTMIGSTPIVNSTVIGAANYALPGGAGNSTGALVAGTFVVIPSAPSAFTVGSNNERFTVTTAGLLTYTGLDPVQVEVSVAVSADMTGAGTADFGVGIFYNGAPLAGIEQTAQVTASGAATTYVQVKTVITVNPGDTIRGAVRNNTNGNPINIYSAMVSAVLA